jgi:hypothetical protein
VVFDEFINCHQYFLVGKQKFVRILVNVAVAKWKLIRLLHFIIVTIGNSNMGQTDLIPTTAATNVVFPFPLMT